MFNNNLFLIGPMGTGKTTIGKLLASVLNRPFKDTDHEIERRCGCDIAWIFDVEGEKGFRQREMQITKELTNEQGIVLATGGGVIMHPQNRLYLRNRGYVIYLRASIKYQLMRTQYDRNRPLLQCDNPAERLQQLLTAREPYYLALADLVLNTEEFSPAVLVQQIIGQLDGLLR